MEEKESTFFFKEDIQFGIRGELNEIRSLKMYLQENPQAKLYITEREILEEKEVGEKRKVKDARYLEVRDRDGEDYQILLQIRISDAKTADNYTMLIAHVDAEIKETPVFRSLGILKHMKGLERGSIQAVYSKVEQADDEGEIEVINHQNTRITKEKILSEEMRQNIDPRQQESKKEDDSKQDFFITESNRSKAKSILERFFRTNEKNNLTYPVIKKETKMRPKKELDRLLDELCFTESSQNNKIVYKLKSI